MSRIRVLLADDHQVMLERLRRQLGEEFEIVGTAGTGKEAVDAVSRLDPDVLVIDISMPVLNGLEAAARVRAACCRTKIVFLTIHKDRDFVDAAFAAGASGYVTKDRVSIDLEPAIREALLGNTFVSQTASR